MAEKLRKNLESFGHTAFRPCHAQKAARAERFFVYAPSIPPTRNYCKSARKPCVFIVHANNSEENARICSKNERKMSVVNFDVNLF